VNISSTEMTRHTDYIINLSLIEILMERVQKYLEEHNTMTLATVGKKGISAAAVFYAETKKPTYLLFVSSPNSEHITNSSDEKKCAATIQNDGLDWNLIEGLQLKGSVELADENDWNIYFEKFPYIKDSETLSKSLEKVNLYKFTISWVRLINNSKGFGNRFELDF
jgi:uncharacterized protein YhbP (UPF0306 family)